MNLKTDNKGFTLIELLIVIVVIAILAAISVVAYTGFQNRAKTSTGQQLAAQVESKAQALNAVEGYYPANYDGFSDADESKLEGVEESSLLFSASINKEQASNGKTIAYNPCGVTGTAPNQKATGADIRYYDFTADAASEAKRIGTCS